MVPGIADEPAWPALRAHLILLEAQGRDATRELTSAVAERELDGARDRAAILDWRLDPTGLRDATAGPLPWVPAIPTKLAADPCWGPYLAARANRIETLADHIRDTAADGPVPTWAHQGLLPEAAVLRDVAAWRAAMDVPVDDRRPTGTPQKQKTAALWQRHLDEQVASDRNPALAAWGPLIHQVAPRQDPFTPLLAEHLADLNRTGLDAADLLQTAAAEGPLPDDHAAAALWWRINSHLNPEVSAESEDPSHIATSRTPADRWEPLARELDPRLIAQGDWPATAQMLQDVHETGHDVPTLTKAMVRQEPLADRPAQDLRYRLVKYLPEREINQMATPLSHDDARLTSGADHDRRRTPVHGPHTSPGPQR